MKHKRPDALTVGILGLGYMGLTTGLAFAARGHSVIGYDAKGEVREGLGQGATPFHERNLAELLRAQRRAKRFSIVDSPDAFVRSSEGIFLCLPTPRFAGGAIDLRPLKKGVTELGCRLRSIDEYRLVVVKSTVVPGTTDFVVRPILRRLSGKSADLLGIAANPEFLAEGTMVRDALHPDRIVVGTHDPRAREWLRRVYRPFRAPIHFLTPAGAELVKYSSNAFLALKISFANEVSRLAEKLSLHIDDVMAAVGADPRIGKSFLEAGPGYGGSCFEKDVNALVVRARELGVPFRSGEVALEINHDQMRHVMKLIRSAAGSLKTKTVAVLGLTFKAGTDDVRGSRAFPLIFGLIRQGALVRVHDPKGMPNFRRAWELRPAHGSGTITFCESLEEALEAADLAVLQAAWPQYLRWRPAWTRRMKNPVLVDLRRGVAVQGAKGSPLRIVSLGVGTHVR